jgi:hypothetical protein
MMMVAPRCAAAWMAALRSKSKRSVHVQENGKELELVNAFFIESGRKDLVGVTHGSLV